MGQKLISTKALKKQGMRVKQSFIFLIFKHSNRKLYKILIATMHGKVMPYRKSKSNDTMLPESEGSNESILL